MVGGLMSLFDVFIPIGRVIRKNTGIAFVRFKEQYPNQEIKRQNGSLTGGRQL